MLSDESSSDSETGRFKCRTKTQDELKKSSHENRDNSRFPGRGRPSDNDRFRREFDKRRDERDRTDKHSRDRQRYSRHSPVRHARRRHSRERSPSRRSRERDRPRGEDLRGRSKPTEDRRDSKERPRHSRSRHKSPEPRRDLRDEVRSSKSELKPNVPSREKSPDKFDRRPREKSSSSSPEYKGKRSAVHVPAPAEVQRKKTESPVVVEEHVESEVEVQPGSYYSMIPAVVKGKSEESSEIDSSDDEKLRAKLLNSEKESHKTRKKKKKEKKHKRKSSKSSKDRDREPATMEVTSTTDIDKAEEEPQPQTAEVTSTQKSVQKESSEEGEISSDDDDSQAPVDIDPTDLRHKLKKRNTGGDREGPAMCGPALPPHLARSSQRSSSREIEGPALPPHLKRQSGSIGPSIPDDMRKVLAERETQIIYESSEEDEGIGPVPAGSEKWSQAHQRLEERALDMKIRRLDGHSLHKSDTKSREQWMLELPEGKAKYLGLEARSFRAREGPDMSDRSSWTDTPEEKARKAAGAPREEDADAALQREARARHITSRDEEQEHAVKKHKKKHKREESLLDIHQKKLKKKKKKEEKESGKERRPFSRDVDLQVNRFDEAQKKSIIKKAQELNTRFGRGEAKYL